MSKKRCYYCGKDIEAINIYGDETYYLEEGVYCNLNCLIKEIKAKLKLEIVLPASDLREVTEDEIRYAAGHPDAIPPQQINAFVRGAKWMQAAINKK